MWVIWALWILILPLNWLLAAAGAACLHEIFHLAAVYLFGGSVRRIRVCPSGAVIEAEGICGGGELCAVLAGPLGSLLLVSLIRRNPVLGLCGLVQGCFNLLPLYPMDGGRILRLLLERTVPDRADRIARGIEGIALFLVTCLAAWAAIRFSPAIWLMIPLNLAAAGEKLRKRP